jgi:hypothetical protein
VPHSSWVDICTANKAYSFRSFSYATAKHFFQLLLKKLQNRSPEPGKMTEKNDRDSPVNKALCKQILISTLTQLRTLLWCDFLNKWSKSVNRHRKRKENAYNFQDLPNLDQLFLFVQYLSKPPILCPSYSWDLQEASQAANNCFNYSL